MDGSEAGIGKDSILKCLAAAFAHGRMMGALSILGEHRYCIDCVANDDMICTRR